MRFKLPARVTQTGARFLYAPGPIKNGNSIRIPAVDHYPNHQFLFLLSVWWVFLKGKGGGGNRRAKRFYEFIRQRFND